MLISYVPTFFTKYASPLLSVSAAVPSSVTLMPLTGFPSTLVIVKPTRYSILSITFKGSTVSFVNVKLPLSPEYPDADTS